MITEDEKIFDIVKLLRTKIDNREEDVNFVLLHRAKTPDNIYLDEELKFWQENDMLRVTISVERPGDPTTGKGGVDESVKEGKTNSIILRTFLISFVDQEKYEGIEGVIENETERFSKNFLERGLPLPTKNSDQIVLISINETRKKYMIPGGYDEDQLVEQVKKLGFNNVYVL
jgi:hypothetical protein